MTRLAVEWRALEPPRPPVAVLGEGPVAAGLADSTMRRLDGGADLRVAVGEGALLVVADPDDLPWAPGATYLGREHGLLLPTTLAPTVPVDLLAAVVRQRLTGGARAGHYVAVLPDRIVEAAVADAAADVAALRRHAAEAFA